MLKNQIFARRSKVPSGQALFGRPAEQCWGRGVIKRDEIFLNRSHGTRVDVPRSGMCRSTLLNKTPDKIETCSEGKSK